MASTVYFDVSKDTGLCLGHKFDHKATIVKFENFKKLVEASVVYFKLQTNTNSWLIPLAEMSWLVTQPMTLESGEFRGQLEEVLTEEVDGEIHRTLISNSNTFRVIVLRSIAEGEETIVTDPDLDLWADMLNRLYVEVHGELDDLKEKVESGYFDGEDGFSPTVSISPIEGGHRITIIDKDGEHTADIIDGKDGYTPIKGKDYRDGVDGYTPVKGKDYFDGKDGFAPTVTINDISGGKRITIVDKDGTHSADILDGRNGDDGVSPVVSMASIEGGYRLSITDKNGTHTADILNGRRGDDGHSGVYIGSTPPIDPDVKVWIDESEKGIDISELEAEVETLNKDIANIENRLDNIDDVIIETVQPLQKEVDNHDRRITNLEYASRGVLYREEESESEDYTKDLTSDVMPWASMDMIGGKSVVFNQLVSMSNVPIRRTYSGVIATPNGDFVELNGTSTSNIYFVVGGARTLKAEHTYAIKIVGENVPQLLTATLRARVDRPNGSALFVSTIDSVITIAEDSAINPTVYLQLIENGEHVTFDNTKVRIDIHDITEKGITTIEQFKAMFPNPYYLYNEGEIISADVDKVVSKGRNLLNLNEIADALGFVKNADGSITGENTKLHNSSSTFPNGFCKGVFKPNTVYSASASVESNYETNVFVGFWYADGTTVLKRIDNASMKVTSEVGKSVVALRWSYSRYDSNYRITSAYLEEGMDITHTPYRDPIDILVPEAIRNLEGYGWSAGSVYNEVDFENKKFIKRVGRVDMGTKNWDYNSTYSVFYLVLPDMFYLNGSTGLSTLICSTYATDVRGSIAKDGDKVIWQQNNVEKRVCVKDSSFTSVSEFKSAMSGVYLYYEFAEPIEIDISDLLDDRFEAIEVEGGGSLTFHQYNEGYRLPVPNKETFLIRTGGVA